jgi:hypothetical protein
MVGREMMTTKSWFREEGRLLKEKIKGNGQQRSDRIKGEEKGYRRKERGGMVGRKGEKDAKKACLEGKRLREKVREEKEGEGRVKAKGEGQGVRERG